jgi:hypothetical protein
LPNPLSGAAQVTFVAGENKSLAFNTFALIPPAPGHKITVSNIAAGSASAEVLVRGGTPAMVVARGSAAFTGGNAEVELMQEDGHDGWEPSSGPYWLQLNLRASVGDGITNYLFTNGMNTMTDRGNWAEVPTFTFSHTATSSSVDFGMFRLEQSATYPNNPESGVWQPPVPDFILTITGLNATNHGEIEATIGEFNAGTSDFIFMSPIVASTEGTIITAANQSSVEIRLFKSDPSKPMTVGRHRITLTLTAPAPSWEQQTFIYTSGTNLSTEIEDMDDVDDILESEPGNTTFTHNFDNASTATIDFDQFRQIELPDPVWGW